MKVIYKKPLMEQIKDVRQTALEEDKGVEKILLSKKEYAKLIRELASHRILVASAAPSFMLYGIKIEEES